MLVGAGSVLIGAGRVLLKRRSNCRRQRELWARHGCIGDGSYGCKSTGLSARAKPVGGPGVNAG